MCWGSPGGRPLLGDGGSYARWIVSSRHYGRCRHLDRDQLLILQPNRPTRPVNLQKRCQTGKSHVLCVLSRTFFVTFKIVKKQNHHQTPFLVVNSLCLRKSINPVLFPPESPDYGKHTAGIPILCQSSHQIFLHYKRNTRGEIESKTTSSLTV